MSALAEMARELGELRTENAAIRKAIGSTLILLDGYVQEVRNNWSCFDGRENRAIVNGIVEPLREYATAIPDRGGEQGSAT